MASPMRDAYCALPIHHAYCATPALAVPTQRTSSTVVHDQALALGDTGMAAIALLLIVAGLAIRAKTLGQ